MNDNEILETQQNLSYSIKYYENTFMYTFNKIINEKTGQIFLNKIFNNYFIFYNENYQIIFYNDLWYLLNGQTIMNENKALNIIINSYLFLTNRLSICLHSQSMDTDMEELNNLLSYSSLKN